MLTEQPFQNWQGSTLVQLLLYIVQYGTVIRTVDRLLSHAQMIGRLHSLLRFFGGAMPTKIAHGEYPVNEQLDCSQVNSHNMYEIMDELKVRRRA